MFEVVRLQGCGGYVFFLLKVECIFENTRVIFKASKCSFSKGKECLVQSPYCMLCYFTYEDLKFNKLAKFPSRNA